MVAPLRRAWGQGSARPCRARARHRPRLCCRRIGWGERGDMVGADAIGGEEEAMGGSDPGAAAAAAYVGDRNDGTVGGREKGDSLREKRGAGGPNKTPLAPAATQQQQVQSREKRERVKMGERAHRRLGRLGVERLGAYSSCCRRSALLLPRCHCGQLHGRRRLAGCLPPSQHCVSTARGPCRGSRAAPPRRRTTTAPRAPRCTPRT